MSTYSINVICQFIAPSLSNSSFYLLLQMKLLLVSTLAATAAAATNHTLRGRDLAKGGVQGANPWKRCDALVESMNNLEGMVLLLQNQLDLLVDGMSTIIEDVDTKIDYMSNEMDLHLGSVVDGISSLIADDMSTLIGDVDTKVNWYRPPG